MPIFRSEFSVKAPKQEVVHFHQGDVCRIFGALAPPGTPVTFQIPMETMSEGATLGFTLWLGGVIPVHWTAVHSEVNADGFVDTMTEGPVESWVHRHSFRAVGENTVVEDSISYSYGPGVRGLTARLLFNPLALRALFLWRAFSTRRMLETHGEKKPPLRSLLRPLLSGD
eukprot:TRINITY_DN5552_c0_g2_i1.p1 TRINITY_DN5552_c0_g2~~TRINITY_DN5552_c0_g2_i1.p1  ORF type:complete len:170 (+),score=14.96 TRINITY_DN5552_c0_g2_i1:85-594(+)